MSESTLIPLLSYLGWSFIPGLATNFLQNIYYRITVPAGTAHPQPGNLLYAKHHRRIRIFVLSLYLLYTLAQSLSDIKLAGDFYTLLSVSPYTTTDNEIKSRVRRLAAKYHPDKLQSGSQDGTVNESHFLSLRLASETLTNPSHKYAYTHFGPSILTHLPKPDENSSAATPKQLSFQTADLVTLALRQKLPSYLITLLSVLVLNTFFLPARSSGKFWRYLIISASFALEFYLLTHDVPPLPGSLETGLSVLRNYTALGNILPPHLLPFQILNVSGRLALSLNIFISQVSVLFPSAGSLDNGKDGVQLQAWMGQLSANLSLLNAGAARLDQEAGSLLQLQFAPFKGQDGHVRELRRGMKEGMVLGGAKAHPEVREAVKRVVERRRVDMQQQRRGHRRLDGADVVDLLESDEQFT